MACRNCGAVSPTACALVKQSSNCWTFAGAGTKASPFTISPILDPSANQLMSCSALGLLAILPSTISNPPACQAFNSANLSIPNNTLTAVTFDSEVYDTDTMHSTSALTNRVTIKTAGTYVITFVCAWDKNITGNRIAEIRKNGTDVLGYDARKSGGADLIVGHSVTVEDQFVVNDYVEGLVQQTSGAALRLLTADYSPFLSAALV